MFAPDFEHLHVLIVSEIIVKSHTEKACNFYTYSQLLTTRVHLPLGIFETNNEESFVRKGQIICQDILF